MRGAEPLCRGVSKGFQNYSLTNRRRYDIINKLQGSKYRGVEQLEARRAHNPEVVGSSPASATIKTPDFTAKSGVFLIFGLNLKAVFIWLTPSFDTNLFF